MADGHEHEQAMRIRMYTAKMEAEWEERGKLQAAQELARLLGADYTWENAGVAVSVLTGMRIIRVFIPSQSYFNPASAASPAYSMGHMTTPLMSSPPFDIEHQSICTNVTAQVPYLDPEFDADSDSNHGPDRRS